MDGNDVIAWSAAVAAVAFAALCIYLIGVLKTAQKSLSSAKLAVDEVKSTIEGLQGEIKRLTHTVNEVTVDVKGKLHAADPLFDAVRDVGVMLRDVTGSARDVSHSFSRAMRLKAAEIDAGSAKLGWMRWAALGVRVMSGIRNGWKEKKAASDNELMRRDMDAFGTASVAMHPDSENSEDVYTRMNH